MKILSSHTQMFLSIWKSVSGVWYYFLPYWLSLYRQKQLKHRPILFYVPQKKNNLTRFESWVTDDKTSWLHFILMVSFRHSPIYVTLQLHVNLEYLLFFVINFWYLIKYNCLVLVNVSSVLLNSLLFNRYNFWFW